MEAVINNNHTMALKRNTNSQKILSLHPYLIQISQSHIINISYLVSIEDNNCILLPPFNEMELLQVSKSFMKKLKRKISMYLIVYRSSLCSYATPKQFHFEDQCRVSRNRIKRFDTVSHCIRNINNPFITNMHFLKCHLPPFYYITKT